MKKLLVLLVLIVYGFSYTLCTVSADYTDTGQPFQNVTQCSSSGSLTTTNAVYTLQANVTGSGTCFSIAANNITLDGNGFSIIYNTNLSSTGGILIQRRNMTSVRNITLVDNSTFENQINAITLDNSNYTQIVGAIITTASINAMGIKATNVKGILIANSSISTHNDSSEAIHLATLDEASQQADAIVSGTTIRTNNTYGIAFSGTQSKFLAINNTLIIDRGTGITCGDARNASIIGNNIFQNNGGLAIQFTSNNMTITNNVINGTGDSVVGIFSSGDTFSIIGNNISLIGATGANGIVDLDNHGTILNNNIFIDSINGIGLRAPGLDTYVAKNSISMKGNGSYGIELESTGFGQLIENLSITMDGYNSRGIWLTNSLNRTIRNIFLSQASNLYESNAISADTSSTTQRNSFINITFNWSRGNIIDFRSPALNEVFKDLKFIKRNSSYYDLLLGSVGNDQFNITILDTPFENYSIVGQPYSLTVGKAGIGSVSFTRLSSSMVTGANLSNDIILRTNYSFVNTTQSPGFNVSSNVTFLNMSTFTFPRITRDLYLFTGFYNFTSLSAGGTLVFNVTGFSAYSITENVPISISILSPPTGTTTALIFNVTLNVLAQPKADCFFNITRGASLEVTNTQVPDCNTVETSVSGDASYVIRAWADNGLQINVTNRTFIVQGSGQQAGGGAGGGGGSGGEVGASENTSWTMTTEQGAKSYRISMGANSTRTRSLKFTNFGTEVTQLTLTCEGVEICKNLVFTNNEIEIPIDPEIDTITTFDILLAGELPNGDYTANIIATDQNGDRNVVGLKVTVGNLGSAIENVRKLFASKQITPTFKVPYFLISFATGIIVFFGMSTAFRKSTVAPAIGVISGVFGGILILFIL